MNNWNAILPTQLCRFLVTVVGLLSIPAAAFAAGPEFSEQVAPILNRYCAGCHNADDSEGGFSVETFASLQRGGERGPAIQPGLPEQSRLLRVLTGSSEPRMPPEGSDAPTAAEIELLRAWVESGAAGPDGQPPERRELRTPKLEPASSLSPITAIACSPVGNRIAVARFQRVEIVDAQTETVMTVLDGLPGKVTAIHFGPRGNTLVTASGVAGLYGHAAVWDVDDGSRIQEVTGHRDLLYDAELSPDGQLLATCSYDRRAILWDVESGAEVRRFEGHNDAVYDIAFSPDGGVLATASGDETVKLWGVQSGERLDTLSQPQAEQYAVIFSPDGRFVLAGGADNRIRIWDFVSRQERKINPLRAALFAHEGAVLALAFSSDGKHLISAAADKTLKAWEADNYGQPHLFPNQIDVVTDMAVTPDTNQLLVARADGSRDRYPIAVNIESMGRVEVEASAAPAATGSHMNRLFEHEPNDSPLTAMRLHVPARVEGVVDMSADDGMDADLFAFASQQGQEWMVEVNAAQSKSPLDSRIEVLDADGQPIERALLQAVRDSYFTFRGKDSSQIDDFRLHNWEEMEINEFLYANGEVVKLWHYPRGPDSGFQVYPGAGKRYTYFDTTAVSHALHQPCYIVKPLPAGSDRVANGLPSFRVYYENDDDSLRELGTDSRLSFRAPDDGDYLVKVVDTRGFQGPDFTYQLTIRPRQPDFVIVHEERTVKIGAGSGQEFSVSAQRRDEFQGAIQVELKNLPEGFHASTPLVIQEGQKSALGIIRADAKVAAAAEDSFQDIQIVASAIIDGERVEKEAVAFGKLVMGEPPQLATQILPANDERLPEDGPFELVISPGETITARVRVERMGHEGRVSFGTADAGRNLPHGVYVDNIGLNGLMVVEGQTERTFFITAADWVPNTSRLFHLRTLEAGNVTSQPVLLRVEE